jgi:hypothetical protein
MASSSSSVGASGARRRRARLAVRRNSTVLSAFSPSSRPITRPSAPASQRTSSWSGWSSARVAGSGGTVVCRVVVTRGKLPGAWEGRNVRSRLSAVGSRLPDRDR